MERVNIINLLTNSGLKVFGIDNDFVYIQDPSCIFPAFDSFFNFAWIVAMVFIAIMLFGWGALYIKNGVKINTLFNNAKNLILVLCIFAAVKPIVNAVYGDKLFEQQCATKQISLNLVRELQEMRKQKFGRHGDEANFEIFSIIDSGVNMQSMSSDGISFGDNNNDNDELFLNSSSFDSNVLRVEASKKSVIYFLANGDKIERTGGSTSWRNNNPGNIEYREFAKKHGAIGTDGRFAIFQSESDGLDAMVSLLRTKNYKNLSLYQAIERWAPSSDGNNPANYAKTVSKLSGFPIDVKLNTLTDEDLRKITSAMQRFEGWNVGVERKI